MLNNGSEISTWKSTILGKHQIFGWKPWFKNLLMKVPGRMSKPATNSPHCQVSRGGGRIDWLFSRIEILVYLHLVVFLNPYFLGVNACISKYMWYCMYFQQKSTYKHTPCYRPPSHRWARRRWSQRSQVQCPRIWWCALRSVETHLYKGVESTLHIKHLRPSLSETRGELQEETLWWWW